MYGAERWIVSTIKYLDLERFDVQVACIRDGDQSRLPLLEAVERLGIKTAALEARTWTFATAVLGLRRLIMRDRIDVVHSHGKRQDLVTLLATRSLGCATVSTPHGWDAMRTAKGRLYDSVHQLIFPFFDAVAPVSEGLRESLRFVPIGAGRLRVIPNGVDTDEIDRVEPLNGLLPGQASARTMVVGYLGQLIPRKGISTLLRALASLPFADWYCPILGDGPLQGRLQQEAIELGIADRVRFLGFRHDRLRYLKRFDLLVLPSYREGIPRSLMEGLAAGVPCVGTNIPGTRELLVDDVPGTTFQPGDWRSLVDAITRHKRDPIRARLLAKVGGLRVREQYSSRRVAADYAALYEKLARAHAQLRSG